jgi:hypothetical protein
MKQVASYVASTYLLHTGSLLGLFFDPPKRRLHFRELHSVISHKIITAVRTSNPAKLKQIHDPVL